MNFYFGKWVAVALAANQNVKILLCTYLEHLGKVLYNVINSYSTFNTIAVDEKHKRVHFVDLKVYSNKDPHFVTEKELKQYQEYRSAKSQKSQDERQRTKIIKELVLWHYVSLSVVIFMKSNLS
jgi:hypothetical protein